MKHCISIIFFLFFSQVVMAAPMMEPTFTLKAQEIEPLCAHEIEKAKAVIAQIKSTKDAPTLENTLEAFEYAFADFQHRLNIITFLAYVSPDEEIRTQAAACEVAAQKFSVDVFADSELFDRFQALEQSKDYKKFKTHQKRLFEDYKHGFEANGLMLTDEAKKTRVVEINKKLSELSNEYDKNIRDNVYEMLMTKEELEGMEERYFEGLEKRGDKYVITPAYPVYFPLIKNAKREETRKKASILYATRGGKENVKVLEELLSLREELAQLLGYATHADKKLGLSNRMAKDVAEVRTFLDTLMQDLSPAYDKEFQTLKDYKCKETKCKDASKIDMPIWDVSYYQERIREQVGDIDTDLIKEYFPLPTVTQGMFEIYETLLGITIEQSQTDNVWVDGVEYFEVRDKKSKDLLGHFYMDMFPREGKYSHAAVFGLKRPMVRPDGHEERPFVAMVCNFNPPKGDTPSLLTHDEVETYFHEFGHVMHGIVSHAQYASQGGTSVARDFVEAPSQMLENWVWKEESLSKLSGHYKTGKPFPKEMLDKLLKLKDVNRALFVQRQLVLASIDMDYHTQKTPVDTTQVWNDRYERTLKLSPVDGTFRQASWGHMTGYDAGYYGYMWSLVYAQDMFSVFEDKGLMSKKIGKRYRETILEPGDTEDPFALLEKFLKRKPSNQAFLKEIGL